MNEAGERQRAKARRNACASGAKPRPEGRVREHAFAADTQPLVLRCQSKEAARRRVIEAADSATVIGLPNAEAAVSRNGAP